MLVLVLLVLVLLALVLLVLVLLVLVLLLVLLLLLLHGLRAFLQDVTFLRKPEGTSQGFQVLSMHCASRNSCKYS